MADQKDNVTDTAPTPAPVKPPTPPAPPVAKKAAIIAEPEPTPLDVWCDNFPKIMASIVTAESSAIRRKTANDLIADLNAVVHPRETAHSEKP